MWEEQGTHYIIVPTTGLVGGEGEKKKNPADIFLKLLLLKMPGCFKGLTTGKREKHLVKRDNGGAA